MFAILFCVSHGSTIAYDVIFPQWSCIYHVIVHSYRHVLLPKYDTDHVIIVPQRLRCLHVLLRRTTTSATLCQAGQYLSRFPWPHFNALCVNGQPRLQKHTHSACTHTRARARAHTHTRTHACRVGIVIDNKTKKSRLGWEPVNARLIRARFFSKCAKTTGIQRYVPSEQATVEETFFYSSQIRMTERCDMMPLL